MGLYLCIFEDDKELDGVEVGPYADFNALRDYVVRELENGKSGSKFPTFILHSDCDGEWTVGDSERLKHELAQIIPELKRQPPVPFVSEWQREVAKSIGHIPQNAFESFVDVDGECVLERVEALVNLAIKHREPILFQ